MNCENLIYCWAKMILWLWDEVVIWLVYFGNECECLNDWLETGNPKDGMENEWFMIGQQEVVSNEDVKLKKIWLGYLSFNLSFR